jgi:hypothetical protein
MLNFISYFEKIPLLTPNLSPVLSPYFCVTIILFNFILIYYTESNGEGGDLLRTVEGVSTAHTRTAVRVPTLSDISLRAVGSACVYLSEQVALNGGVRPDIPWMQVE